MLVDKPCTRHDCGFDLRSRPNSSIDHPLHYGGESNVYEAIKVIEAWELGFNLGNAVKYVSRAGKKGDRLEDLKKAKWYLEREIQNANAPKKE